VNATAWLVGFRSRHDAESDLTRSQRTHAALRLDLLATGRQNGRHAHQVLLLYVRVAQGEFERRQPLPMDTDAAGEEKALRNRKHVGAAITLEIG
jgi:hypothetical protein